MRTTPRTHDIERIAKNRLLFLDGAMGTMVQRHRLTEADFRGTRFADHPRDLRGDNDILVLTQPDVIRGIHEQYLAAGADMHRAGRDSEIGGVEKRQALPRGCVRR